MWPTFNSFQLDFQVILCKIKNTSWCTKYSCERLVSFTKTTMQSRYFTCVFHVVRTGTLSYLSSEDMWMINTTRSIRGRLASFSTGRGRLLASLLIGTRKNKLIERLNMIAEYDRWYVNWGVHHMGQIEGMKDCHVYDLHVFMSSDNSRSLCSDHNTIS